MQRAKNSCRPLSCVKHFASCIAKCAGGGIDNPFRFHFMTPEEADKWLRELGLFHINGVDEHYKRGVRLIGKKKMSFLAEHFNGEHEDSESYLSEKCGEDPYFSLIQSQKYTIFKEELLWLDQTLPENALVFDLGCSTGHMTALCAKMRPCSKFVGIDRIPSVIKKAISIKEKLGMTNLSFEQYDFTSIGTTTKPDGIISLQALGPFLYNHASISYLSNFVDLQAFIILVEAFQDLDGLKDILKTFNSHGFSLINFDKIHCGKSRKVKTMPGILLARGFETTAKIDIETIRL